MLRSYGAVSMPRGSYQMPAIPTRGTANECPGFENRDMGVTRCVVFEERLRDAAAGDTRPDDSEVRFFGQ